MRPVLWILVGVIAFPVVFGLAGLVYLKTGSHGFSARANPMWAEKFAATQAKIMAMPSDAKDKKNPLSNSPDVIAEGRAHWADHCAICHANNGS